MRRLALTCLVVATMLLPVACSSAADDASRETAHTQGGSEVDSEEQKGVGDEVYLSGLQQSAAIVEVGALDTTISGVGLAGLNGPDSEGHVNVTEPSPFEEGLSRYFLYNDSLVVTVDGEPLEDYLAALTVGGHMQLDFPSVAVGSDAHIEYQVLELDTYPYHIERAVSVDLHAPERQ